MTDATDDIAEFKRLQPMKRRKPTETERTIKRRLAAMAQEHLGCCKQIERLQQRKQDLMRKMAKLTQK